MSLSIFSRLKGGEVVSMNDKDYPTMLEHVTRTRSLIPALNASTSNDETRSKLSDIIGSDLDQSVIVFVPFHTNFGRHTSFGKNVFINHDCSFLDLGGITLEDDVWIGPKVCLVTENHPLDPKDRHSLICNPILLKRNAWIGAGAIVLPGVTVGENSVVAAGSVVSKDVPDNVVVAGIPAKVIRLL
jgi:acetyltransferase-like isoleucine patch superfamily enzyme